MDMHVNSVKLLIPISRFGGRKVRETTEYTFETKLLGWIATVSKYAEHCTVMYVSMIKKKKT